MSKSSELNKKAKRYIIDCIDNGGYDQYPAHCLMTPAQKIDCLREIFQAEYGWSISRYGEQRAICEWLQGLPTACTIAFNNCDIITLAKEWGSIPQDATEKQEDKILEFWFMFMANKLCQLFHASPESINKLYK